MIEKKNEERDVLMKEEKEMIRGVIDMEERKVR